MNPARVAVGKNSKNAAKGNDYFIMDFESYEKSIEALTLISKAITSDQ
jgi:hypothetical protein